MFNKLVLISNSRYTREDEGEQLRKVTSRGTIDEVSGMWQKRVEA